ncbi:MAG TPA: MerR family transcriptional regulator [Bryobacteraceae bacterium]|nr:MerR family transcriptional regulator [Bryobacteraceae bacterium]
MLPERVAFEERVFLSADVGRIAGVSLRQLQWWDEGKLVSPRIDAHRRIYVPDQVLEILVIAALRRKGLSLQKTRKILRLLRRELGPSGLLQTKPKSYLVTDGNSAFIGDQPAAVLGRIAEATKAVHVVSLGDLMKRIASEAVPRRYRAKQLELF